MGGSDVERIQVNVRVDKSVKDAFDEQIIEIFGTLRPYAGIELERECRSFLDRGDITELKMVVEDLTAVFVDTDCKKKIRKPKRRESTTVGYRISDKLRRKMKIVAEDDYRSFGRLIEAIMYTYVREGRVIQRLTDRLHHVLEQVEQEQDNTVGAKDRRTQTITSELEKTNQDVFDMADFEEAIEAASGISASKYTKQEYLPRVLDELNFTWDPENPGRFIAKESYDVPDLRDVTRKPYHLMSREDKRKAIKIKAYRSATSQSALTIEDASAVLQGRPNRSTIKGLLREIDDSSPGFRYSPEKGKLKVDSKVVTDNPGQNLDVIAVEYTAEDWVNSAVESLIQLQQDMDHELRDLPDIVLDNKISKAKYPGLATGINMGDRTHSEYITRHDREEVLERLADELGKPSIEIYSDYQHQPDNL
jgi:predicted HicB family RNase H-like nuclease